MKTFKLLILSFIVLGACASIGFGQTVSNVSVQTAVEDVLEEDRFVNAHLIDSDVEKGAVTLTGSIDNILSKERAVELIRSVRGVNSVINLIDVNPVDRTDKSILADIQAALTLDKAVNEADLSIDVNEGVVDLEGKVYSLPQRSAALKAAKGIRGVKDVKDRLEMVYESKRADQNIKADIERRFEIDAYVPHERIQVQVKEGKVILSGKVSDLYQHNRAYQLAWITGVDFVENIITVDTEKKALPLKTYNTARIKDEQMKQYVRDALRLDPRLYDQKIDIDVQDHRVTLSGRVGTLKAVHAAREDAENTIGVRDVTSRLKVRPDEFPQDHVIAKHVKRALQWDPLLDQYKFDVFVKNKKIYVSGRVGAREEKRRVEDLLSGIEAVVAIENNVEIINGNLLSDRELEEKIRRRLKWNVFFWNKDIDPEVEDGLVVLTGSVNSWQEYARAYEIALDMRGVERVINRLELEALTDSK